MKIAYYTDQIYLHGGLERVLANKLNYLSNYYKDIQLYVITFQQNNNPPCYEINNDIIYYDLNIDYDRSVSFLDPKNIKKAPKHYIKLKRAINRIKPDIIVVCNYEFGFYFIPLLKSNKIIIKEYHSSRHYTYEVRKKNNSFIKKIIYGLTDYFEAKYTHLVLLNNDELKYYNSQNKIVIPNSLTFYPENFSSLERNRVISAGRIAPVKGFEKLISAWKIVNTYHKDWILDIYGEGEPNYMKELEEKIKKIGLEGKVRLKGATNNLKNEMLNASLYAMTSLTECFPMVLLESMSCGLPIVSFDCPNGPRNIITNGEDGILVENQNVELFAKELINLMNDSKRRKLMGTKARKNVLRFNEKEIMPKWLEIFKYKNESIN